MRLMQFEEGSNFYHEMDIYWVNETARKVSKYGVISGLNTEKYEPEIAPYLNTLHAVAS